MIVTKFNHIALPSFVWEAEFTTGTPAWWVTIDLNDYRLFDGDYIICDDNGTCIKYISLADYAADLVLQNTVREAIGKELIRSIWSTLNASGKSNAEKAGIATNISPVIVMILTGEIVSGRFLANAATTDANYTAGVKSALLNLMDVQIAKL